MTKPREKRDFVDLVANVNFVSTVNPYVMYSFSKCASVLCGVLSVFCSTQVFTYMPYFTDLWELSLALALYFFRSKINHKVIINVNKS